MVPWVVHDLRRTVVTHLAEGGFAQPHIIEAIVNHVTGHKAGVAGVYNHAEYAEEKRKALDLWAAHLTALVEKRVA
jgi:integrase